MNLTLKIAMHLALEEIKAEVKRNGLTLSQVKASEAKTVAKRLILCDPYYRQEATLIVSRIPKDR